MVCFLLCHYSHFNDHRMGMLWQRNVSKILCIQRVNEMVKCELWKIDKAQQSRFGTYRSQKRHNVSVERLLHVRSIHLNPNSNEWLLFSRFINTVQYPHSLCISASLIRLYTRTMLIPFSLFFPKEVNDSSGRWWQTLRIALMKRTFVCTLPSCKLSVTKVKLCSLLS